MVVVAVRCSVPQVFKHRQRLIGYSMYQLQAYQIASRHNTTATIWFVNSEITMSWLLWYEVSKLTDY